MNEVFKELLNTYNAGGMGVLASVIYRQGSTPMSGEAKMFIRGDGKLFGTVGGGCTEARVMSEGKKALYDGLARTLTFTLTEKEASLEGHICGGRVQIFLEPVKEITARCAEEVMRLSEEGRPGAVATIVSRDETPVDMVNNYKMVVRWDGTALGSLGNRELEDKVIDAGLKVIDSETAGIFKFDSTEVFIEPIPVVPTAYIFGAGHISYFVAKVAKMVGFRVVVIDDRPQYANKERFPDADEVIAEDFEVVCSKLPLNRYSYIVIVTRGHQHDAVVLEQVVYSKARYIGMIGSRSKVRLTYRSLEEMGVDKELLKRVYAPVGIEIRAQTPEEIAVSIVAEMIMVRRGQELDDYTREAQSMKVRPTEKRAGWI